MVTLLILTYVDLKVALICLFTIDVVVDALKNVRLLLPDLLVEFQDFLTDLLGLVKAFPRSLKDGLGDVSVCVAHELVVLRNLRLQQVREDLFTEARVETTDMTLGKLRVHLLTQIVTLSTSSGSIEGGRGGSRS